LVASVESTSRTAPTRRPYSAAAWSSADPVPQRLASGITKQIVQYKILAIAPEEKLGYNCVNPTAAESMRARKIIDWLFLKRSSRKRRAPLGFAGLAIKLKICIKQPYEEIEVGDRSLTDVNRGRIQTHSHHYV
jgi:hypothetical protein